MSPEMEGHAPVTSSRSPTGVSGRQRRQSSSCNSRGRNNGELLAERNEDVTRKAKSFVDKATSSNPSSFHSRALLSSARKCPLPTLSGSTAKLHEGPNLSSNMGLRTSSSTRVQSEMVGRNLREHSVDGQVPGDERRKPVYSTSRNCQAVNQRRRSQSPTKEKVHCNTSDHDEDDLDGDWNNNTELEEEQEQEAYVFEGHHIVDNVYEDNEEESLLSNKLYDKTLADANDVADERALTLQDESRGRRERRQELALREREADRRKKEGRPRNFLLVDKYTRKPHRVGVGYWRKELMLLSQKLDPAVGNINHHPEGAVAEIADWIQHTGEYSVPLHFEYIKEVIARGVTLRRADLWRKIRNNEPKPEGVSDRSWRLLRKQLQSPIQMKKSESCRRANASRINFGRTGPSGEVGVRQRLKRALRRSLDPEEIQREMSRDKGYGGCSKRKKTDNDVMHGSEVAVDLRVEVPRISGASVNFTKNAMKAVEEDEVYDHMDAASHEDSLPVHSEGRSGNKDVREQVLAMTADEIAQHPLVLRMMQRLEALEGRDSALPMDKSNAPTEEVRNADNCGKNENIVRQMTSQQMQDEGNGALNDEGESASYSRRTKKRQKQN